MSAYTRDLIVLALTAAALVVAIVVTAQGMFPPAEKGVVERVEKPLLLPRSLTPEKLRAPMVDDVQLPTLPSMTTEEAHGD